MTDWAGWFIFIGAIALVVTFGLLVRWCLAPVDVTDDEVLDEAPTLTYRPRPPANRDPHSTQQRPPTPSWDGLSMLGAAALIVAYFWAIHGR